VVTAPGSGAEIIPFLKTWVNLPMAIGFTILYAQVRKGVESEAAEKRGSLRCGRANWQLILKAAAPQPCIGLWGLAAGCEAATAAHTQNHSCPPAPPSHDDAPQLANVLSVEALFYTCIIPFIIFFGAFAFVIYPAREAIHPTGEFFLGGEGC